MPSWISKFGKWTPAKEYAVDPRAPKGSEVYSGPDRAALLELSAAGQEYFGEDYRLNTDMLMKARSLGYKSVEEFLKEFHGFDPKEQEKKFEVSEKVVNEHPDPKRKPGVKTTGGGVNMVKSGEKTVPDMDGGFGEHPRV